MDKRFWRILGSRKALTKMQAVAIVVIIVVVAITVYYYTTLPAPAPTPFSMQVIPEHIKDSIPEQRCVFLVVVEDEGEAVDISATTSSGSVTVNPQTITPEQVAEVTVIPDEASVGGNVTVTVSGERDGLKQIETVTVWVVEGEDGLWSYATKVRDAFIPWLAANHPEFGITSETEWTGTIVYPGLYIYSYYLFFSDEWEMGVCWHVTRVPDDWAEIYLRKRFTEVQPSYAFRIDSFKTEPQLEPHVIDPLDLHEPPLWR